MDDDRVRPPLVWEPKPVADGDDYKPVNNDTCSYQHGNHPDKYARSQRIPDRFHVHNRADSAFGLMEWLCIRSIKVNANPADGIYFHYVNEPTGPWWELAKPMVKMVKTYKLETYMGYKLKYPQHGSVVLYVFIRNDNNACMYVHINTQERYCTYGDTQQVWGCLCRYRHIGATQFCPSLSQPCSAWLGRYMTVL